MGLLVRPFSSFRAVLCQGGQLNGLSLCRAVPVASLSACVVCRAVQVASLSAWVTRGCNALCALVKVTVWLAGINRCSVHLRARPHSCMGLWTERRGWSAFCPSTSRRRPTVVPMYRTPWLISLCSSTIRRRRTVCCLVTSCTLSMRPSQPSLRSEAFAMANAR